MELIDSNLGWKAIDQRIQRTTNDRHLGMLMVLRRHMEAEMIGDLEGMLAGLVAKPKYHMWGSGTDTGPKDFDSIRQYYVDLLAVRRGVLEYAIERIVIDDDAVVTEGTINAFQPGAVAKAFGYRVEELNATYLVTYRALIIWPFDLAGALIGEDGYGSINPDNFVKVDGKNLPDVYVSLFDKSEYASIGL